MSRPRLHVTALSHLDTQWRWTVRDTVARFLPRTVDENERLFERYPSFVLSFEGAWRYRLLAEHDPRRFATVRRRVREGRWFPAGSAIEAFDTLLPAPESIVRQIVFGTRWFERELGRAGSDLFLPDCFGFPAILPTIAGHCGIRGFSTQKLRRGDRMRSAFGIPFAFGRWRGPDGTELLAALDPGEYSGTIERGVGDDPAWIERFRQLAAGGGGDRLLLYVGTGDRGGGLPESTVAALEAALATDAAIEVVHGPSEEIFVATGSSERERLPSYEGELLLHLHASGCYTAKAAMKRWNRIGECLARAAEAAWSLAALRGAAPPAGRFEEAWTPLLAHQMHDDLTGTSIPAAYAISFDDLGHAANRFAELLLDAVSAAAAGMGGAGDPLVLSTTSGARTGLVEIPLATGESPAGVIAADGRLLPVQRIEPPDGNRRALVPVVASGVELVALRFAESAPAGGLGGRIEAAPDRLESDRLVARFDDCGRLRSLFDCQLDRELLAAPLELELLPNRSRKYPAWEILWSDLSSAPIRRLETVLGREVIESGPLRAALCIERRAPECRVRETWSLAASPWGDSLQCRVELDWYARGGRLLKARFPLTARSPRALYDTGLGVVDRPIASERLYEVPAQAFAAIVDEAGGFGTAIFSDCRHGWDQPDASTLRSTWIHAPRASWKFRHQASQDRGRHRFRFALAGFSLDELHTGRLAARADQFLHPLLSFRRLTPGAPDGESSLRLLDLAPSMRLLAVHPAAAGGAVICRFANAGREPAAAELRLHPAAVRTSEVDALERERPTGEQAGDVRLLAPSALRALRIDLAAAGADSGSEPFRSLPLPLSVRGFSRNGESVSEGFDGAGTCLPLELTPARLAAPPVPFDLGHLFGDGPQVAVACGQVLEIPPGFIELWLLAAAIDRHREAGLRVGAAPIRIRFPDWRGACLRESWLRTVPRRRVEPERFRRTPIAFASGHLHDRHGNDLPVERGSLFALRLELAGDLSVTLPDCRQLRLVAATLARSPARPVAEGRPLDSL